MNGNRSLKYYYAVTIFSPVLGVYYAVKNLTWKYCKPILILAITFFGSSIILQSSDGFVLKQMVFEHYVGLSFDQWLYELKEIFLFSPEPGTKGDLFSHALSFIVGQILGIPNMYFSFVSLIYAYFFVNGIEKVLNHPNYTQKTAIFWFLIIIFISYRFVDNMQTVRTWTGLWALFNGVYGYYATGKKRYLLLMLTAPLFHVAYFAMALPAYAVIFIKRLTPLFFVIVYVISFFITFDHGGIIDQLEKTDLGEQKVQGYYREDPDEYIDIYEGKSLNFYTEAGKGWSLKQAPHFLAISIIVMGLFSNRKMNSIELGVFSTGLLMATMANLGDFVPAFYSRTMVNAGIYITATAVLLLKRGALFDTSSKQVYRSKIILWMSCLSFLPYIIYTCANMLQFTSIYMLAVPIFGFFSETNLSFREFIGFIL